jgi:hypothetical protein
MLAGTSPNPLFVAGVSRLEKQSASKKISYRPPSRCRNGTAGNSGRRALNEPPSVKNVGCSRPGRVLDDYRVQAVELRHITLSCSPPQERTRR